MLRNVCLHGSDLDVYVKARWWNGGLPGRRSPVICVASPRGVEPLSPG